MTPSFVTTEEQDHFLSLLKSKVIYLDDHFGCPLLKMTITWIDYFFGRSLAIKIYSCIKDFILIALGNLILT